MQEITKNEEALLIAVLHLKERAYGVNIREKLGGMTGKSWNYGTLYRLLDRAVNRGMLMRKEGEPLPEKGGRRKNYYSLTKDGVRILRGAYAAQRALWDDTTRSALETAG